MAKKILGVENLDVIRDFVLSKVMTESDEIKRTLTEENAEYLQSKILEATNSLKSDYESKYDSLTAQIEKLKLEGGDADAIRELELQLDALNNNYVDMQNSLNAIEDSIIDIESSVMSPGQLNELLDAALIEKTTITDDMVETPNLYTKNLVALIAKFGTVRALNIVGDEIEGKTISAYDKIEGTNEPTWKLDRQGDGYLANKNISWDKNGNVTFGEKVKLDWNTNIDNAPDISNNGLTETDVENIITTTITKDYIESKNIIATNISAATIAGKTLQSDKNVTLADSTTGPTWKIMNDGTGYLAKKNISWDADGNLEVKGKLLGTLGNGSDDVYLDGTLAIIDNDSKVKGQVLSALSGETTAYETYLDEDDVEHKRFITLATGFPEGIVDVSGDITLYRWVVKSDASSPKYTTLFTTYAYDDYKNGDVIELVYYFNGTKYVLADGEYRLYSGQIKKSKGTTAYGWVTDKYIYSVDLKTKYTYANTITVNNTQFNILQSAKTKIYSDGSIVTDNLHAEQGFFGGTIKAKGEFSGRLKECSGSIVDSRITNATINDSVINIKNYNTFTASRNNKEGNNETIFAITPKKNLDKAKTPVTYWWNKYSTYKQNRSKKDVLFKSTAKGESIFKFEVNKGDTVVIPAMYVSATVYQPRKKDITNKTKPMVGLFVKTPDGYKDIANGVLLTRDDKSAKYNKHQYTYGLTTASQTFTVSKGGTCEILFGYDVTLANKQCLDYAACTFSVDVKKGTKNSERCITVTPKDNDRNVMKIGANGIQIITTFGHKLTTTDGYIKMISANGKYGLQVDDNGIKVLRANEGWKKL